MAAGDRRRMAAAVSGLRAACAKYGDRIVSIGVDTWGVDYGRLGADGELLESPFQVTTRRALAGSAPSSR